MTSSSYYNNMIPSSLTQDPSDDQDQTDYHQLFTLKPLQASSSSSSSSSFNNPIFVNEPAQDQERCYYSEFQHLQNGSFEDDQKLVSNVELYPQKEDQPGLSLSLWKKEEISEDQTATINRSDSDKWMPSKMRMIRKMMSSEKKGAVKTMNFASHNYTTPQSSMETETSNYSTSYNNNNNSSSNNSVRVCADCSTTKTPLWRSGPKGPKSLCNACGIRQRKARRALAAAAAAANGTILPTPPPSKKQKVQHKDKRSKNHGGVQTATKKKCKASYEIPSAGNTKKKICFEDFLAISLRKHSACQRVFPQDEKEAAILLMALSCGLVRG